MDWTENGPVRSEMEHGGYDVGDTRQLQLVGGVRQIPGATGGGKPFIAIKTRHVRNQTDNESVTLSKDSTIKR